MATLEITLFGTLRVQRPGRPVLQFPTRRARDLFSYLLVNRHTLHAREVVAELFWDGANESNPRHCLNTALWRLNRVLGEPEAGEHPFLRVDSQRIGFNTASDCRLDIAEFENRCLWAEQIGADASEQQAALYHQALPFYQADLLVDCYEEWCIRERERLQRIYLRALGFLVDYHAAREEYQEATDCATRLLAYDPLREDVHRKLIDFYLAASQPAAALRQYQTCEAALRRELGADPAPETQAALPRVFNQAGAQAGAAAMPVAGGDDAGRAGAAPGAAPAASAGSAGKAAGRSPKGRQRAHAAAPQTLAAAVARLRAAVAEFDQAQAQLREAATTVEGLACRLLEAPAARPTAHPPASAGEARYAHPAGGVHEPATILLGQAARLVAGANQQLVGAS